MSFQKALDFVLKWENVYRDGKVVWEDDPSDPGGLTKFGLDQRSHPNVDIRNLTEAQAREIYRHDYWNKIKADKISEPLDMVVMDIAVNNGVGRASKWLQGAVGAKEDGVIGPITLGLVAKRNPFITAVFLLGRREEFYHQIATGPKVKFLEGWKNRNHDLLDVVKEAYLSDK
jgi:lysozyme family protein